MSKKGIREFIFGFVLQTYLRIVKFQLILSVLYNIIYLLFSGYELFLNHQVNWINVTIFSLTIASSILMIIYFFIDRADTHRAVFRNAQSILSLLVNLFRILLLGSNIIILINVQSAANFYDIITLILASLYLAFVALATVFYFLEIIARVTIGRKIRGRNRNKDGHETVATISPHGYDEEQKTNPTLSQTGYSGMQKGKKNS